MMVASKGHRATDPLVRLRLFGPVEALSFSGESVLPRGRKAQAILCYLALTQERFIPRQRLISLLWSSRWIEQGRASLRQSLLELRNAFGCGHADLLTIERDKIGLDREKVWIDGLTRRPEEEGDRPLGDFEPDRFLETLIGIDPSFDEWIARAREQVREAFGARCEAANATLPKGKGAPAAGGGPAEVASASAGGVLLSVLPILQIGSTAIDDYIAPSLTQEIVTALARLRWLRVRFSTDRGSADYLLDGYVSGLADGFRLVLRLLDRIDREIILWTGTMQLPCPLQTSSIGEVVEQIVEQLDPEILAIETRKALRRPPAANDSYDCLLRAVPLLYRFEQSTWRQATDLLERACRSDPQHGRAFAFAALCRVTGLAQGWSRQPAADLRRADEDAAHAVACDPRDSLALALNAHIKSFIHHDFDAALALFERAIRANPSCGLSWGYSSLTFAYLGRTDEASRRLVRARSIMTHDPYLSFMESFAAVIAFFAHDWPQAIAVSRRQLELRPTFVNMRKILVSALCLSGAVDEAMLEDRRLREQEPDFDWSRHLVAYPFGRREDRAALEAALRRARLIGQDEAGPPHGLLPSPPFASLPAAAVSPRCA